MKLSTSINGYRHIVMEDVKECIFYVLGGSDGNHRITFIMKDGCMYDYYLSLPSIQVLLTILKEYAE